MSEKQNPYENPRPMRPFLPALAFAALVTVVAALPGGCPSPRSRQEATAIQVEAPRPEACEVAWARTAIGASRFRALPGKPLKKQKKQPCSGRQVPLNGACWRELADGPDESGACEDSFPHKGKCYVPVMEPERPPVSVGPSRE